VIKISFIANAQNIDRFKRFGPAIVSALFSKLNLLAQQTASVVIRRLSGEVLQPRSGVLRGSVVTIPAKYENGKITAAVEAGAGPSNPYAWAFEKGGKGSFTIAARNKKSLMWEAGGSKHFAMSVLHPKIRQLAFMQPSEDEMRPTIIAELTNAINEATKE